MIQESKVTFRILKSDIDSSHKATQFLEWIYSSHKATRSINGYSTFNSPTAANSSHKATILLK